MEGEYNECPKCENELIQRRNGRTGEYFLGCKSYPKCRYTENIGPKTIDVNPLCPTCLIPMTFKRSKLGGSAFYGCVNWKECGTKPINIY